MPIFIKGGRWSDAFSWRPVRTRWDIRPRKYAVSTHREYTSKQLKIHLTVSCYRSWTGSSAPDSHQQTTHAAEHRCSSILAGLMVLVWVVLAAVSFRWPVQQFLGLATLPPRSDRGMVVDTRAMGPGRHHTYRRPGEALVATADRGQLRTHRKHSWQPRASNHTQRAVVLLEAGHLALAYLDRHEQDPWRP